MRNSDFTVNTAAQKCLSSYRKTSDV